MSIYTFFADISDDQMLKNIIYFDFFWNKCKFTILRWLFWWSDFNLHILLIFLIITCKKTQFFQIFWEQTSNLHYFPSFLDQMQIYTFPWFFYVQIPKYTFSLVCLMIRYQNTPFPWYFWYHICIHTFFPNTSDDQMLKYTLSLIFGDKISKYTLFLYILFCKFTLLFCKFTQLPWFFGG